jgi:hypothetical protein
MLREEREIRKNRDEDGLPKWLSAKPHQSEKQGVLSYMCNDSRERFELSPSGSKAH